jgi:hypothetical protein
VRDDGQAPVRTAIATEVSEAESDLEKGKASDALKIFI